jgi:hypothetical protein
MHRALALLIMAVPAWALDNSVRIYDASGAGQTAQPRTIHRYFAQGEIPAGSYPKPRIDGVAPAAWQVDVESSWPDGSVMAAFVSLPVSVPANGSVVVDFVNDSSACHLGALGTCQAAGLTQQQMLDFNGGEWGAVIEGTANGTTYSASARTMVSAGAWTYRMRGPVVTQVLVEDLTRPNPVYDFGWEYNGSAWQAPSDVKYRSIHPWFTLAFYAGWAGVEVELMAVQAATTRFQRQVFDLAVKRGSSGTAVVYTKTAFDLPRSSAFTRYFWDGAAPAGVQVDFNLKYMIYSRILPPFDYSKQWLGSTDVLRYDSVVGSGDPQDCRPDLSSCGNWTQYIPSTGGRGDIGLIPRWYVTYLFAMGDPAQFSVAARKEFFDKLVVGNADAAQTIPFHYLEYDNSALRDSPSDGQRYYMDAGRTGAAFGRVASTYARPEWLTGEREPWDGTDKIVPVCTAGPCSGNRAPDTNYTKGWVIDAAHMPSPFAVPYMLTGRRSYMMGQLGLASYMAAHQSYSCYYYYSRCGDWALQYTWGNQRSSAWVLREVGMAALISPPGSPERAYFGRILEKNDELWEGIGGVLGGNAQATTSSTFCRGSNLGSGSVTHTSTSSTDWNGMTNYKLNGVTKTLGLPDPAYSLTSLTVDGVVKTFGVLGVDTGRDWYYVPGGMAVFQDEAADPVAVGSTVVVRYQKTSVVSPWCSGRNVQMKGQPNILGHQFWNESRSYGSFMLYYFLWTKKFIEDTGAFVHSVTGQQLFKYSDREAARHLTGWATDSNANPHYADYYASFNIGKSNMLPPSWGEYMKLFPSTSTLVSSMTNSATTFVLNDDHTGWPIQLHEFFTPQLAKVEDEWMLLCSWAENSSPNQSTMTVCAGGRGMFGSVAVSHPAGAAFHWDRQLWNGVGSGHSYPNLYASSVAMYEEYSFPSGTGRRAWERVMGDLTGQQNRMSAPEYAFVPRDRITGLRAVNPSPGTLRLEWVAPSMNACLVYAASGPRGDSLDTGDAVAVARSREQSYTLTGVPAGTVNYRVTCGTARASGVAAVN